MSENIVKKITIKELIDPNNNTYEEQERDIAVDSENVSLYKDSNGNYTDNKTNATEESLTSYANNHSNTKNGKGRYSVVEGLNTTANQEATHAEGKDTAATAPYSHAEGYGTSAIGINSHAEGSSTKASGTVAHAEGMYTTADGYTPHAEGVNTKASSYCTHAEGFYTIAKGYYSHTQNEYTIAQGASQTAIGKYNIAQGTPTSSASTDYALIIGNGTNNNRSNALAVRWDGAIVLADGTILTVEQLAKIANL